MVNYSVTFVMYITYGVSCLAVCFLKYQSERKFLGEIYFVDDWLHVAKCIKTILLNLDI